MALVHFITELYSQNKVNRDYLARMADPEKAHCMDVCREYGKDYWDGDRKYGYGGYSYDGRWKPVAEKMIAQYGLTNDSKILDVGCGKGYLVYELQQLLPDAEIVGIDISKHAISDAKEEIKSHIKHMDARFLEFEDNSFDFVFSNAVVYNFEIDGLYKSLSEIERVSRGNSWISVESYRNAQEQKNLMCWSLSCYSFYGVTEWEWLFNHAGYTGDYEFFFFE
jgi:SAM-dependent methyltransferase